MAMWVVVTNLIGLGCNSYTDSNTRERLPYELDGFIAAKSRLLLQRELTWGRHSFLYNIAYPTWREYE